MHRLAALCLALVCVSVPATGQAREITLSAPAAMAESGFLKYILPRFSLKHGIRVKVVGPDTTADIVLADGPDGRAAFDGGGATWRLTLTGSGEAELTARFSDWLLSDAGQAAVAGFTLDGAAPYGPPSRQQTAVAEIAYDGDAAAGEKLSLGLCGRCHVVGEANRMNGIGSTPSFAVLKALKDWEQRFTAFYVLKPHGAFTQIEDVTAPFPIDRPSPIAPIEMTLDQLDNIVAYVAEMPAADLGRPLELQ